MSVILKVDEKVGHVISLLPEGYSENEFLDKFKEIYPEDYSKCMKKFLTEERKTKPGKTHPMQHPDHHIKSALRSYLSRKSNDKTNNNLNLPKNETNN